MCYSPADFGWHYVYFYRRVSVALVTFSALGLVTAGPLSSWSFEGHRSITRAAVELLGPQVPLDRDSIDIAIEGSVFPDLSRPVSLPELNDLEYPQHYINLERLGNRALPPTRSAYLRLVSTLDGSWTMGSVGTLPYALTEATQRLATVFRQMRSDPESPRLQWLAQHYAGVLAHYSEDLCQPLHTSVDHDGRALPDGSSPMTGIHTKVDRLFEAAPPDYQASSDDPAVEEYEDVFAAVVSELMRSHALVDHVFELESDIQNASVSGKITTELEAFVAERFSAATRFTASLIQTAWKLSETFKLPGE
jgi:hypothetical protein